MNIIYYVSMPKPLVHVYVLYVRVYVSINLIFSSPALISITACIYLSMYAYICVYTYKFVYIVEKCTASFPYPLGSLLRPIKSSTENCGGGQ